MAVERCKTEEILVNFGTSNHFSSILRDFSRISLISLVKSLRLILCQVCADTLPSPMPFRQCRGMFDSCSQACMFSDDKVYTNVRLRWPAQCLQHSVSKCQSEYSYVVPLPILYLDNRRRRHSMYAPHHLHANCLSCFNYHCIYDVDEDHSTLTAVSGHC